MNSKHSLRAVLREARRAYAADLPVSVRALLFKRPPAPLMELVAADSVIGLYHASDAEAPTASYARFFFETGYPLALPWIGGPGNIMEFRRHCDPFEHSDLEAGPHQLLQPRETADVMTPDVVFVPLVGFTADGTRLGQGGGFYDRWLARHPGTIAIGMAWDMQLVDDLPVQPHDMPLHAVVTPTRIYGPFHAR